jgi:hypothetical protein
MRLKPLPKPLPQPCQISEHLFQPHHQEHKFHRDTGKEESKGSETSEESRSCELASSIFFHAAELWDV